MQSLKLEKSDIDECRTLIHHHIDTLAFPLESWLEDNLFKADFCRFEHGGKTIGYVACKDSLVEFFHVLRPHFRQAPQAFELAASQLKIKKARVFTLDSLFMAVIAEWDYGKEKNSCFFLDSESRATVAGEPFSDNFRKAQPGEEKAIRAVSGDFFDEAGGGFETLEERVAAETIFMLEDKNNLLGCGAIEKSRLCPGFASIGMLTNPTYRKMGVAKQMIVNLKRWVYRLGLAPVAGCWYYNTLSRKSLESAGMIVTAIGYDALLRGKEKVPLQTKLPPRS